MQEENIDKRDDDAEDKALHRPLPLVRGKQIRKFGDEFGDYGRSEEIWRKLPSVM